MAGGGGVGDSIMMTNLIPSYIPQMQGWAEDYLDTAFTLSASNFAAYSGTTYAAQNSNETNGIAALVTRGTNGSLIESHGETYLRSLLTGGYIGANPYLDDAFQKALDQLIQDFEEEALPGIEAAHAFSFGGSEHNADEARASERLMAAINSIAEKIYFTDHITERKIQDAGLDHAVPYGQRGIRDAEILRTAGVYAREYTQGSYKDSWAKWNETQVIHTRNLDIIGNALRTIIGTSRTASTKYYKPPAITEVAGLALTGISLYGMSRNLTMNSYSNPAGKKLPVQALPRIEDLPKPLDFRDMFFGQQQAPQNVIDVVPSAEAPEVYSVEA